MNQEPHNRQGKISLKKRILSVPTLISFAIAFVLILFLVIRFDVDWGATWEKVRDSDPRFYILAFLLYYVSFIARGWRWQILAKNAQVHAIPGANLPSILQCSQFILLGWFANTVTWFRLGDAYRAYVFAEGSKGSFSRILGTVVAERVMDMATVFFILVVVGVYLSISRNTGPSPVFLLVAFAMVSVLVVLLLLMRGFGLKVARVLPQRLSGAYEKFHQGTMGSFKQLPMVFVLGLVGWMLEIGRLYFVIDALGMSVGFPLVVFVTLAGALLTTVPITPGGLGIVEPGIVGLLILSLSRGDAVSVAVLDRSISYLSIVVLGGLLFVAHQLLTIRASRRASKLNSVESSNKAS